MQNLIANQARSWIGTRFKHQGRVKACPSHRGGVDCIGLIIGVANELELRNKNGELLSSLDKHDYSRIPDGDRLKQVLDDNLTLKPTLQIGDVVLMRIKHHPQHVGFIGDYPGGGLSIIHSYIEARGVVEHQLDTTWKSRIIGCYGW